MTARLLQIGEVAEAIGLSLRTVRYYEQMREQLDQEVAALT